MIDPLHFLPDKGEMATLIRQKDWSETPVGPPATWPQSLRTLVHMMLNSRFPMFIFWGAELITFYNDAFRPSLGNNGKHPASLGQRAEESWAESWPVIGPMMHNIMAGGEAVWVEDQKLPIYREGQMGYAYWTYSFSSVLNDEGAVGGVLVTCSETTEQVLARQKIKESEVRFQAMAEDSDILIAMSNEAAQSIYLNQAWADLTGRSVTDLMNLGWVDLVHPDDREPFLNTYLSALSRQESFSGEFRILDRHGAYRWLWVKCPARFRPNAAVNSPARPGPDGAKGTFAGYISSAIDITDRKQAQQQLEASERMYRQLATELEERVRLRTHDLERSNLDLMQFASVASHDLKEPLRKVQTFGSRLQETLAGRLNEEETDLFRRMVNATVRMQTLVTDILRLSKLSDPTVRFEPVNLNAVVDQIRDDLELTIYEQEAELVVGHLPTVEAVAGQMHQLLLNLISNALKFQADKTPQIRLESVPITNEIIHQFGLPSANYAVITISDNGIGFDPKYKNRIFGMFQRLHGKNQYAGTGIGLTIVKKIVENHGGAIDVQSEPGQGTTFWVALPLALTAP
jgi:PAS domain S-box-containing protein